MKKLSVLCLIALVLATVAAQAGERFKMGIVVKVGGIPWFNAMEIGIKNEAEKLNVDAWMVGPVSADPALQVRAIEDLIARGVDVIGVVPNDLQVLEPVLKRARGAGIKIISHEGTDLVNKDWNVDLVDVPTYAITHAKRFAELCGGEGKYAVYVGTLTAPLHNAWCDVALDYLKKNYPNMELVADRFGVAESVDESMNTANELMAKYPDLKGILTFGSQGPIGAGRAVLQRGMKDSVVVVGGFSPGQGQRLVESGGIKSGYNWNPMTTGHVLVKVARMAMDGTSITDGMEFENVGPVKVDHEKRTILGNKLDILEKEYLQPLVDMGL